MDKKVNLGYDNFRELMQDDCYYVDKSLLIRDIIMEKSKVLLFTRPRRFGKTLNMSMLYYFFSNRESTRDIFSRLLIGNCDSGKYMDMINGSPVIFFTIKDCKGFGDLRQFIGKMKILVSELYKSFAFLLENERLSLSDRDIINGFIGMKYDDESMLVNSLKLLSDYLHNYYDKNVYIIIDEYDAPVIDAWINGCYREIMNFMKIFLGSALKSNLYLDKAILTGVFKVSKENLFSDLNNISSYDIYNMKYSSYFGFTVDETKSILSYYNLSSSYNKVKKWYDGYLFGNEVIFNPWSILNFISDSGHRFIPYWANTGGTDLLRKLIYDYDSDIIRGEFYNLLDTEILPNIVIDYSINLDNIMYSKDAIWSLFMSAGYLKPSRYIGSDMVSNLEIPNYEVKLSLENIVINWFKSNIKSGDAMVSAVINDNPDLFKEALCSEVIEDVSFFDVGNRFSESFYHGFILGLLGRLRSFYEVRSNRESGFGRYDICLKPLLKRGSAYVMEFKSIKIGERFEPVIRKAFKQISDKKYETELKGFDIIKMVIVFRGKEVRVEYRKGN